MTTPTLPDADGGPDRSLRVAGDATPSARPARPVLIAGGGPVGLALSALLAEHGIASIVIEADEGYCSGSRAICVSRRSQEIFGWFGADGPLTAKGLPWTGGRSHFRADEVLHFQMPSEPGERFAPMVNIQQFYIEQFAHEAMRRRDSLCELRLSTRVTAVRQGPSSVEVDVEGPQGKETLTGDWLVACDGGRSTVREQLGLQLGGMQYEGRYVIVDIEQATERPVERLAWFDPPSNPGSTILMHRQPDDVWRVDYQIRDDEDPAEAVKPENVLPRVRSHLEMIGETAPWKPLWISIYNAKCLTLDSYRHGRVMFAGDAAHLVPIFGVRGLNSGLDDAANLAWKLALVVQGRASDALLDTYSTERVHATRENLSYGARSTEFMAPPNFGFRLMREAALRLAGGDATVRPLINPRQSTPIRHAESALNVRTSDPAVHAACGDPAPEAAVQAAGGPSFLSRAFGHGFVALWFSEEARLPQALVDLSHDGPADGPASLRILRVASTGEPDATTVVDIRQQARTRYDADDATLVLVRPDGYVMARWRHPRWPEVAEALAAFRRAGLPAHDRATAATSTETPA
jgi:3-(3-hydroxy-phenyl)propionate hydroxylase